MPTVLVIDDDPGVLATVGEILTDQGHSVVMAGDGHAGVQAVERYRPDLVICDIFMPEQDGLGAIRELSKAHPTLPILAISGRYVHYLKIASGLGASAVLLKPFRARELERSVDALLHDRSAVTP
jgi:DNA-binding response OmpR family regulator